MVKYQVDILTEFPHKLILCAGLFLFGGMNSSYISIANAYDLDNGSSPCFMVTSSGKKILLSSFCGFSSKKAVSKMKLSPSGSFELRGNQTYSYPDGTTINAKGHISWPNGIRAELVPNSKGSGFQYYNTDGKKLTPGQLITLPNGVNLKQESL